MSFNHGYGATRTRDEHREKLLETNRRVQEQDRQLQQNRVRIEETKAIGQATASSLAGQREQLENTRDNLDEADDTLDSTRKTLVRMGRRIITDKIIQGFIILLELAAIGLIVWMRWIKDSDKKKD